MVSRIAVAIAVAFALTLISSGAGLWIFYSHMSPLMGLAEKRTMGQVLDSFTYLRYELVINGESYTVEVNNDPSARRGTATLVYPNGSRVSFSYNYTSTLVFLRREGSNVTLNPLLYTEAFATSLVIDTDLGRVEPFPGIAPLFAVNFLGNATRIDWRSLYDPRAEVRPQNVVYDFETVKLGKEERRGVLLQIDALYSGEMQRALKWYSVSSLGKLANKEGLVVAGELTLEFTLAGTPYLVEIRFGELRR
ncbi:MAG: hypothetical protein NZ902_00290 [Acidilobaceae archaeon]|nr:hypothetical protein [Acidilobaceae archaeon]MCX8165278.1 hypothetical protein [Acidilobaceae archaeon]MDW7973704.1 hypothetical protein [Sulfolobales archaeon]